MLFVRTASCLTMIGCALTAPAFAQSAGDSAPGNSTVPIVSGFDGGFFIQSGDGDNRLTFGLVAQIDGRFSTDNPAPTADTFTIRKARPMFTGQVAKYFDFKLVPDFGNGKAVVQDANVTVRFSPMLRVRFGKDKVPVGYELLQSDPYLFFPERSLASSLVPNRDIGVSLQGDVTAGRLSYIVGIYNGVPDGTSSSTDIDSNNAKELAGRIVVQPFGEGALLHGMGFHFGASSGTAKGALPSFATSVQQTYFSYAGASAEGTHTRIAPAVFYYGGPFGGFAEYIRSTQAVAGLATTADVTSHAWDVSGSWLVTGETASPAMIHPLHEFKPETKDWGAIQVVARYSVLTLDREAFARGFAAASAAQEAEQFTVGTNWLLNPFVKFYATYERTSFRGGAPRPAEHVILLRSQLSFGDRR